MTENLERQVRTLDPESSWEAAKLISAADAAALRDWIMTYVNLWGPVTDEQLVSAYRRSGGKRTPQRVRTAREALVHPKRGKPSLRQHETDGVTSLGNRARRWVVALDHADGRSHA